MIEEWQSMRPTLNDPSFDCSANHIMKAHGKLRLLRSVQIEQGHLWRTLERTLADECTINIPMANKTSEYSDMVYPGTLGAHSNLRYVSVLMIQKMYRGYLVRKKAKVKWFDRKTDDPLNSKQIVDQKPTPITKNSRSKDALSIIRESDIIDDQVDGTHAGTTSPDSRILIWDQQLRENLAAFKQEEILLKNRLKLGDLFTYETQEEEIRKNRSLKWRDQEMMQNSRQKKSQTIRSELTDGIIDEAGIQGSDVRRKLINNSHQKSEKDNSEVESIEEEQHLKVSNLKASESPKKIKSGANVLDLNNDLRQLVSQAQQLGVNERTQEWIGGEILRNLTELEKDHEQNKRIRELLANQFENYSLRKQHKDLSQKEKQLLEREAQLRNWEESLKDREARLAATATDKVEPRMEFEGSRTAHWETKKGVSEEWEFQERLQRVLGGLRQSGGAQHPEVKRLQARTEYLLERDRQAQTQAAAAIIAEEQRLFAALAVRRTQLRLQAARGRPTAPPVLEPLEPSRLSASGGSDYPESQELVSDISWVA